MFRWLIELQNKHSKGKWISYTIHPLETIVGPRAQSSILNNSQSRVVENSGCIIATTFLRPLISCNLRWPASIHLIVPGLRRSWIFHYSIASRVRFIVAVENISRPLSTPRRCNRKIDVPLLPGAQLRFSFDYRFAFLNCPATKCARFVSSVDNGEIPRCGLQASPVCTRQKFPRINPGSWRRRMIVILTLDTERGYEFFIVCTIVHESNEFKPWIDRLFNRLLQGLEV